MCRGEIETGHLFMPLIANISFRVVLKNSENLLYYELIDLIRSPEILKFLTGSYIDQRRKQMEDSNERNQENALQEN